jgi:hypothetical protein
MKNGSVLYKLNKAPGSDLYISNSGIAAFFDHSYHFRKQLIINFYSPEGIRLSSLEFLAAYLFGFSEDGDIMGISTPEKFTVYYIKDKRTVTYPKCMSFDIGPAGNYLVCSDEKNITVYEREELSYTSEINSNIRKIKIVDDSTYCFITRNEFVLKDLRDDKTIFSNSLEQGYTYNDLLLIGQRIFLGINSRQKNILKGYLSEYSDNKLTTPLLYNQNDYYKSPSESFISDSLYDPVPWPFFPYDNPRTVWNHYEQHMGTSYAYLHQGLDIITPIEEPTYTIQQGVVKLVMTTGGSVYWRTAVSPVQQSGRSNGWLYAHLIETTIPVFPGDTVEIHEYIGDIIQWYDDWGHIHLVEINDSGLVWLYEDDEWGINFNPLLALQPLIDTIAPVIMRFGPNSAFKFCTNETSNYLPGNNLSGEIDIIIRVVDYIGESEWQQPAFKSYYWIKRISDDSIVYPKKLGHILNHKYSMYASTSYTPYAKVIYKLDAGHPAPSWMNTTRNFYHVITNNNGDELIDTSERFLSLDTREFYDGYYRIYVEVFDPSGNSSLDSMDVKFNNGIIVSSNDEMPVMNSYLYQNYPNPFNPSTTISFQIAEPARVILKLYDLLGSEAAVLLDEFRETGYHKVNFNADDYNLSSGFYIYKLSSGKYNDSKKLIIMK